MAAHYADNVIKSAIVLHNYLITTENNESGAKSRYIPPFMVDYENEDGQLVEGNWRILTRNDTCFRMERIRVGSANYNGEAKNVRNLLANYFMNEGAVPFQEKIL
jgi:hypothetical protein